MAGEAAFRVIAVGGEGVEAGAAGGEVGFEGFGAIERGGELVAAAAGVGGAVGWRWARSGG